MNIILQKTVENGLGESIRLLVIAQNIAKYNGLDFDKNDVVYNVKDLIKLMKEKKNTVIVFNEAPNELISDY